MHSVKPMKYLPQELEVWYVLPALRRAFAVEMDRRGLRGVQIARLLGVTKAAVSQYLSRTRAVTFTFDASTRYAIQTAVGRALKGSSVLIEMQILLQTLRNNKSICKFHQSQEEALDPQCDLCFHYG